MESNGIYFRFLTPLKGNIHPFKYQISYHLSFFMIPTLQVVFFLLFHSLEDVDLEHYSQISCSQILLNVPSFDRPSLLFAPTPVDFEFISPLSHSLSLLYIPIQRDVVNSIQDILIRSTTSSLTDSELAIVGIPIITDS